MTYLLLAIIAGLSKLEVGELENKALPYSLHQVDQDDLPHIIQWWVKWKNKFNVTIIITCKF